MAQLSIDPVTNYYRVAQTLVGRILLFFVAGWCGIFLGRISVAFQEFGDLARPWKVMDELIPNDGLGVIGEVLIMVFWPVSAMSSASGISVWLFFLAMGVTAITFAVFIYSEEPAPAWWLGLVGFTATLHVIGDEDSAVVSWIILITILTGIGSALWWALRVFHPELVESVGDLLRGRSSRPGYSSYAKRPMERDAIPEPPKGVRLRTTRSISPPRERGND